MTDKVIFAIAGLVVGAATGSGITYMFMEKKHVKEMNEVLAEQREKHLKKVHELQQKLDFYQGKEATDKIIDKVGSDEKKSDSKNYKVPTDSINIGDLKSHADKNHNNEHEYDKMYMTDEQKEAYNYSFEVEDDGSDDISDDEVSDIGDDGTDFAPRVISYEEYGTNDNFDTTKLEFYRDEDAGRCPNYHVVLFDEGYSGERSTFDAQDIEDDFGNLIEKTGFAENGKNMLCIRNYAQKVDYCLVKQEISFQEAQNTIGGF